MPDKKFKAKCITVKLDDIVAYTFSMPVKDLVHLYYVAVRGKDDEDGAVQRPLSRRRIESVRDYILDGNTFFNSFILNWNEKPKLIVLKDGTIAFPLISEAAQAIDGQHRLAGLEAAMEIDDSVSERDLIVTMCIGLSTKQAATIFLNINTEQRPVPKSLLFDLFGETASDPKHAINRAKDIASHLNDDENSPLYRLIKFPGATRGSGKIELSTFVTAFKPSLEMDGEFYLRKLKTLEHQQTVIKNYFDVLKTAYTEAEIWTKSSQNPFFKAAGFNGAVDFLLGKLVFKCAEEGDFSKEFMTKVLDIDASDALTWEDLKGMDGKTARKRVTEHFERGLLRSAKAGDEFKF
ncbi:DGQHR domain-containing protein [Cognatiyoonia koreensis]|uniref:DGQHR domain-containing protein n=1 Tax=Cognatiyoonia koreensis TaxID=364200 RepID=A0A1I0MYV6_9RHOB|nr:DGQHR domain-containing protein [Cognatiyoonia koreensis]SEV93944.1 DGQHR domain-containing protein [Cognatiyoonia koreensis]